MGGECFTTMMRDDARYMTLDGIASSEISTSFILDLACRLKLTDLSRKHEKPGERYLRTVGAIVCDLLQAAYPNVIRYSHHSMRHENFSNHEVGCTNFTAVCRAMLKLGLIKIGQMGHMQPSLGLSELEGSGRSTALGWQKATRLRATIEFLGDLKAHGIVPEAWSDHFVLLPPSKVVAEPLVLRAGKVLKGQQSYTGTSMPIHYDSDPRAVELRDEVVAINEYLGRQSITPVGAHAGYRRIFNNGHLPSFAWNMGGRLYSLGGGYQSWKKEQRQGITLNGERVVEIDLSAAHLTILHALRGVDFELEGPDPYSVAGLPRSLVKDWVTMTLGHSKLHDRWPQELKAKWDAKLGVSLQVAHPLKATRDLILSAFPVLRDWGEGDSSIKCFDLQYVESKIIVATLRSLALEHDVPCLVVHDSIIVPASSAMLAVIALAKAFEAEVGVFPMLTRSLSIEPDS